MKRKSTVHVDGYKPALKRRGHCAFVDALLPFAADGRTWAASCRLGRRYENVRTAARCRPLRIGTRCNRAWYVV